MLILLGISLLIPAIVCLLIVLFSDKKTNGNGKSILGLIGVSLILCIPIVSTTMLFVWAFGENTKSDMTFRNYARLILLANLYFILFIVSFIFFRFAFIA